MHEFVLPSSIFLIIVVAMYVLSIYKNIQKTDAAALYVFNNVFDIVVILVGISGIMALVEVVIPAGFFAHAFDSLSKLILTAIGGTILGSITAGPPILSYPIAKAMLDEGIVLGTIGAFISAWSLIDPISLPVEIRFLGKKFAFWRFFMSFIVASIVGVTMSILL